MLITADVLSNFNRGPGDCEKRTARDTSKPQVKKSEIGTTTISSYKSPEQNSLGKIHVLAVHKKSILPQRFHKHIMSLASYYDTLMLLLINYYNTVSGMINSDRYVLCPSVKCDAAL